MIGFAVFVSVGIQRIVAEVRKRWPQLDGIYPLLGACALGVLAAWYFDLTPAAEYIADLPTRAEPWTSGVVLGLGASGFNELVNRRS